MSIRTGERATFAPHRWTWLYSAALFGHAAVNSGASSVLTPQLVSRVDEAHKVVLLGMISATWGVVSLVGAPLIGALSDRTTSPRGRRHPWILAGALGTSATLVAMAQQTEPIGLILLAVPAAVFPLMMTNGLTATLVDDVPPARRATVSGWANGVATCTGLLGGTALVSVAFTGLTTGCLVSAILVLVLVVPFACLTRGTRSRPTVLRTRVELRTCPDFVWALGVRFGSGLASAMATLYLLFFLQDAVRHNAPAKALLILTVLYVATASLVSVPIGRLSDRWGRRKGITTAGMAAQGLACALLAISQTWPAVLVAAVLLGIGYGVYMTAGSALIAELLPDTASHGRDLGVVTAAGSIAEIAAPAVAAPVVAHLGGYPVLYATAAGIAIVSALLLQPIKSVR